MTSTLSAPFVLLLLIAVAVTGLAGQPGRPISDAEAVELLDTLSEVRGQEAQDAIQRIREQDDKRFIAVLIELQRAGLQDVLPDVYVEALEALSGQQFGRASSAWREWYATSSLEPPPGFTVWKGAIFARFDPRYAQFLNEDTASTIRVEEIEWGGVPVDGIPPLEYPPVIPAAEASELSDGEPVFGLFVNGEARAYPLRIMDQHEMANDIVGGEPVTLAYCTLCGAGIAYRTTQPDGAVFDFGTSGLLYRSNKLMYDRQTRTLWNQLTGAPVVGELAGSGILLEVLPIVVTTWADWQASHPDTLVLDLDTGFERQYRPGVPYSEYFANSGTWFPHPPSDTRLPDKAQVLAIDINGEQKAYPLDIVLAERVINDQLGGLNLVVVGSGEAIEVSGADRSGDFFSYEAGAAARAYERAGNIFSSGPEPVTLLDQRGQVWTLTEEALIGPAGQRLARLPAHLAFWFGWTAFYPDTGLYVGSE